MSGPLTYSWQLTNAPSASARYDDVWFHDANLGWAIRNDAFTVLKTEDGGDTWVQQLHDPDMYFRCIGFADARVGWASGLPWSAEGGIRHRLYHTTDGGENWCLVRNLPHDPYAICGLSVVSDSVVVGSGTNAPSQPPAIVRTLDGGGTWTLIDMSSWASLLVDNHFVDENRGWVVGGKVPEGTTNPTRSDAVPVVLYTEDGGANWENQLDGTDGLMTGEWGWKIHFLSDEVAFVSLQSQGRAAVLRTDDCGSSWRRLPVSEPAGIRNLQGVGFVDSDVGWVGGWHRVPSTTSDGGNSWSDAGPPLRAINRFRFLRGTPLIGFAAGEGIYKYTTTDSLFWHGNEWEQCEAAHYDLAINVPESAASMQVEVWDGFGWHVATLFDGDAPAAGKFEIRWDFTDREPGELGPGLYHIQVTIDERSESKMVERG